MGQNGVDYHDRDKSSDMLNPICANTKHTLNLVDEHMLDSEDFAYLKRVIVDQHTQSENGKFEPVNYGKELNSQVLLNSSNLEASFGTKAGEITLIILAIVQKSSRT